MVRKVMTDGKKRCSNLGSPDRALHWPHSGEIGKKWTDPGVRRAVPITEIGNVKSALPNEANYWSGNQPPWGVLVVQAFPLGLVLKRA
jgi:hypothetical protein